MPEDFVLIYETTAVVELPFVESVLSASEIPYRSASWWAGMERGAQVETKVHGFSVAPEDQDKALKVIAAALSEVFSGDAALPDPEDEHEHESLDVFPRRGLGKLLDFGCALAAAGVGIAIPCFAIFMSPSSSPRGFGELIGLSVSVLFGLFFLALAGKSATEALRS